MAGDFGDESGQSLLDNFVRFGEQMGIEAMRSRAYAVRRACDHARAGALAESGRGGVPWVEPREWAKLDMGEFQGIEGYEGIRGIIEKGMSARGVDVQWYSEESLGKEFMLFRIKDAREVWEGFGALSREAGVACEKAAAAVGRAVEERAVGRGDAAASRPAEDREAGGLAGGPAGHDGYGKVAEAGGFGVGGRTAAERVAGRDGGAAAWHPEDREAGWLGERGGAAGDAVRGGAWCDGRRGVRGEASAREGGGVRARGALPRDDRALEERAEHARAASAALEGERGDGRSRGLRMQEVRSK